MQINLNPTSERGASRDAVNRPRETLGDSHLISSDPRSRFLMLRYFPVSRRFGIGENGETLHTGQILGVSPAAEGASPWSSSPIRSPVSSGGSPRSD